MMADIEDCWEEANSSGVNSIENRLHDSSATHCKELVNDQPQQRWSHRKKRPNCRETGRGNSTARHIICSNSSDSTSEMNIDATHTSKESANATSSNRSLKTLVPQTATSTAGYEKGVKKFVCTVCGAAFTSNSYLTIHKRSHSGEKPFCCAFEGCSAAFKSSGSLSRHENTHTRARSYVCPECGDAFTQSSSLNTHRRKHTGYRPHQCEDCERSFVSSTHLKKHRLVHTGERPHVCEECGAQFPSPHNLKRHQMIHSGERPFICRECGDTFITNDDLKRHVDTHKSFKRFTCPSCPAAFNRITRFRKHMLRHKGLGRLKDCDAALGMGKTEAGAARQSPLFSERGTREDLDLPLEGGAVKAEALRECSSVFPEREPVRRTFPGSTPWSGEGRGKEKERKEGGGDV